MKFKVGDRVIIDNLTDHCRPDSCSRFLKHDRTACIGEVGQIIGIRSPNDISVKVDNIDYVKNSYICFYLERNLQYLNTKELI
jgi:hypothetical protein